MRIFLLGLMFTEKSLYEAHKYSKCGIQMAPHVFQQNLQNGFEENGVNLRVINIPPIGSFPNHYRKLLIHSEIWGEGNKQIGYINLPIIKHKIQAHKLKLLLKEIRDDDCILVYSLYHPFLQLIRYIKKKKPNVKICIIQTDAISGRNGMPKYMSKRAIKQGNYEVGLAKNCDCFVLLTKYLSEVIETNGRPFSIIECIANDKQVLSHRNTESSNICLYTGTIDREFGILDIVEAFKLLSNAQLWICGTGNTEEILQQEDNNNIRYFGYVPKNELDEYRNKCDFMINPRRPEGTYTLYSFPSKTAEYLMTGKPTIMYKLEGIPNEYDEFLNYLNSDTPNDIARELKEIFCKDYDELVEKAIRGRNYMKNLKSAKAQTKKILEMLQELEG